MLNYAEEILLLALDDESGRFRPLPDRALDYALAGASLAELALSGAVSIREKEARVLCHHPMDDPSLERVRSWILGFSGDGGNPPSLDRALTGIAADGAALKDLALAGLVRKGILRETEDRFLWVFHLRRYPVVDDREEREVKQRIREVVLGHADSNQRDRILIALMDVCQLSYTVFSVAELDEVQPKIRAISQQECLGRAMVVAIEQIQRAMLEMRAYSGI